MESPVGRQFGGARRRLVEELRGKGISDLAVLKVDGQKVTYEKQDIPAGLWPYNLGVAGSVVLTADNGNGGRSDGHAGRPSWPGSPTPGSTPTSSSGTTGTTRAGPAPRSEIGRAHV